MKSMRIDIEIAKCTKIIKHLNNTKSNNKPHLMHPTTSIRSNYKQQIKLRN